MKHIPYGYRIENGMAVVDETEAGAVQKFFDYYISGLALMAAAEKVGLKLYHGSAGRVLRNVKYLGADYFPAIIDRATFDKTEEIRMNRAKVLGRVREQEVKQTEPFPTKFTMPAVKTVYENPFEQASSYEVQVEHYTQFIQKNPEWELAGIFADDETSGCNAKKRSAFIRMIKECMAGD